METDFKVRGSRGGVPTRHRIRAAIRAARVLTPEGTRLWVARDSYLQITEDGIYRLVDYLAGQEILLRCGLLRLEGDVLYCAPGLTELLAEEDERCIQTLAELYLSAEPPVWLRVAVAGDGLRPEYIPDEAQAELERLIPDPERREALLLSAGHTFDDTERRRIGVLGEEHVAAVCRDELTGLGHPELAARVIRISALSDQLGYDVTAPSLAGTRRLEVKTTRAQASAVEVFLSRNEVETGLRDPDWALVICRIDESDTIWNVAWCRADTLRVLLPVDPAVGGRWEVVKVTLSDAAVVPGVPPADAVTHCT